MAVHTYISLFSGYGGLDVAIRAAVPGARCVGYVEREAAAAAILAARMADGGLDEAPIWSDVRTFPSGLFRGRVGGIVGGFPCQDLSVAGRRAGIHGDRSGLFHEILRIAQELDGVEWIFLENVSGLVSSLTLLHRGDIMGHFDRLRESASNAKERWYVERHIERLRWRLLPIYGISALLYVCCRLEEIGFRAEVEIVTAEECGAPHKRERVFILAYRSGYRFQRSAERDERQIDDVAASWRDDLERCNYQVAESTGCGLGILRQPSGRDGFADGGDEAVADTPDHNRRRGIGGAEAGARQGSIGRRGSAIGVCRLADTERPRLEIRRGERGDDGEELPTAIGDRHPLFPPGPADTARWADILAERPDLAPATESEFRGLADGAVPRVDRLRAAGNGVVPLQGALAFTILARRLT